MARGSETAGRAAGCSFSTSRGSRGTILAAVALSLPLLALLLLMVASAAPSASAAPQYGSYAQYGRYTGDYRGHYGGYQGSVVHRILHAFGIPHEDEHNYDYNRYDSRYGFDDPYYLRYRQLGALRPGVGGLI